MRAVLPAVVDEPGEELIQQIARELHELTGAGSTGTARIVARLRLQVAALETEIQRLRGQPQALIEADDVRTWRAELHALREELTP